MSENPDGGTWSREIEFKNQDGIHDAESNTERNIL